MADNKDNTMKKNEGKGLHLHISSGLVALVLTVLGLFLFIRSYGTGYYIYGQMNSVLITVLIVIAIVSELALLLLHRTLHDNLFVQMLPLLICGLLGGAAMLILGDRVEGIGNCIVSDYDSGHGGEEAIYMSLIGAASMLAAMVYCIIGAFSEGGTAPAKKLKTQIMIISGSIVAIAALTATVMLTGTNDSKTGSAAGGAAAGSGQTSGTYTISFNQKNNNIDEDVMPDYQFLSSNMGGLARSDARFYIDVTLSLNGSGGYSLTSDAYVFDSGKRVEVGDPSGLGLVYKTTSEGSYVDNADGTVTTSAADHVKFELTTDTYSAQMKSMMAIDLNGSDDDGEYDSADYPVLLDYVPETIWTLDTASSTITTYKGTEEEESDESTAEAEEEKTAESAAAAEPVKVTSEDGGTSMTFNADGTYVFVFEAHGLEDPGTWTYKDGKLTVTNANGAEATAEGDPMKLHYVSAISEQLTGDFTVKAADLAFEAAADEAGAKEAEAAAEPVKVSSDDGGTSMTFNADGTYVFVFEAHGLEDPGTWTYKDGKLTVTNANGVEATAEGDPMKLHYVSAINEQLTGDFTIPADQLG